jgi:hypothetical protein
MPALFVLTGTCSVAVAAGKACAPLRCWVCTLCCERVKPELVSKSSDANSGSSAAVSGSARQCAVRCDSGDASTGPFSKQTSETQEHSHRSRP